MSDVDEQFRVLLKQAGSGEIETVLAAVKRDPRLATRAGEHGRRLLYNARWGGQLELARGHLVYGAQVNEDGGMSGTSRWRRGHQFPKMLPLSVSTSRLEYSNWMGYLQSRGGAPLVHLARTSGGWDALMIASFNGHLAVVGLLLSKGADPNSRNARQTALSLAAEDDNLEICLLLISHAADLLEIVRDGETALDLYGVYSSLTPEVKKQRCALLRKAYDEGPHPNARWVRRWPFVCVLVGCDFQPLAARKAYLLMTNPPLPPDAAIPPIPIGSPELYRAYLHGIVFSHPSFWKLIASYL